MTHRAALPFPPPSLTEVEIEIALRIVAAHNARQIAAELNLTEDQVQNHLLAIFEKTGCDTGTQLAAAWTLYDAETAVSTPSSPAAQVLLLTIERNALRDRVRELQRMVGYLAGRPAEYTEQAIATDLLRMERDALRTRVDELQKQIDAPFVRTT